MTLKEAVEAGNKIIYAPMSGGLMVVDPTEENRIQIESNNLFKEFFDMQEKEIQLVSTKNRGHHILHGQVQIWTKKK